MCGLKSLSIPTSGLQGSVTPFTGVWIEIVEYIFRLVIHRVTPFTGVWIEIRKYEQTRKRKAVTPFTGVWIEIPVGAVMVGVGPSHTLHGCVD